MNSLYANSKSIVYCMLNRSGLLIESPVSDGIRLALNGFLTPFLDFVSTPFYQSPIGSQLAGDSPNLPVHLLMFIWIKCC